MNQKELIGIFLMVVIGLALTPAIQSNLVGAQYGRQITEAIDLDPATSNTTTLGDGPIRNGTSTYFVVTLNGTAYTWTGAINYTVASIGGYNGGGTFTWEGLSNAAVYNGTAVYWCRLTAASYTLAGLLSIFWVILLMGIAVVSIVRFLKTPRSASTYRR